MSDESVTESEETAESASKRQSALASEENPWAAAAAPGPEAEPPPELQAEPAEEAEQAQQATGGEAGEDPAEPQKAGPKAPPPEDYKDRRIRALEGIIEDRDATLRDYIAAHKAEKANMEAFKNRMKRDQEHEVRTAAARRVGALVDVLDNLFMTAGACREGGDVDALVEGVEIVAKNFLAVLESDGLRRIDPTGEVFDPTCMEAMTMIPVTDEAQNNKVLETIRPGYWIGDQELRPAMVTVGRRTG
jgi:molecular chaperone GrpE